MSQKKISENFSNGNGKKGEKFKKIMEKIKISSGILFQREQMQARETRVSRKLKIGGAHILCGFYEKENLMRKLRGGVRYPFRCNNQAKAWLFSGKNRKR